MIRIKNLTYNYDKRFSTLYELNLNLQQNQKVILLNDTSLETQTLFRLISKQDKIQKGEIFSNGKNINDIKRKDLSICYITQTPFLLNKTVSKNLIYPLTIRGVNKKIAIKKAEEILETFNLTELKDKKPRHLSNFEKILVTLMRAMMREYEILLIDDIFNFNERENNKLIELINKLMKNKTCLISFKDNKLINNFENIKILELNYGKIK